MSDEPIKTVMGKPGEPMFDACFTMMEAMREAIVPILENFPDPRDAFATAMTAAAIFSGAQAGTLMTIGAYRNQDRRRLGEAALTNFRQGIDLGLSRGMRMYAEQVGGNA